MHPHRTALQCCEGPAEAASPSGAPLCSSPASSSRSGGSRAFRAICTISCTVGPASPICATSYPPKDTCGERLSPMRYRDEVCHPGWAYLQGSQVWAL